LRGVDKVIAIRNYNDTKCELNIAIIELDKLEQQKEDIRKDIFGVTSKPPKTKLIYKLTKDGKKEEDYVLSDENYYIKGTTIYDDKMAIYMSKLEDKNEITGKSLNQSITDQTNVVNKLKYYLNLMNDTMASLKGIEYKLYYAIIIDENNANKTISQIIEELSPVVEKEPTTLWHNYYPNIKNYLEKLEIYSEDTVNIGL
jgi:hypothetical protein